MPTPPPSLDHLLRSGLLEKLEHVCSKQRPSILVALTDDGLIEYQEERLHSKILSHLLDSNSNEHAMGDTFLKSVLNRVSFLQNGLPYRYQSFGDLSETTIVEDRPVEPRKDLGRPDFYLRNDTLEFAVVIENKVRHRERQNQLSDYWDAAQAKDPKFKIGGVFLAPERRAIKTKYPYLALTYSELADILEKALSDSSTSTAAKGVLASEYLTAVRRWFVLDPQKKELAWKIRRQYPKALDLLQEPEADPMQQLLDLIWELIVEEAPKLECLNAKPKRKDLTESGDLGFVLKEWNDVQALRAGAEKEPDTVYGKRLISFWVAAEHTHPTSLRHDLAIYLAVASASHAKDKSAQKAILRACSDSGYRKVSDKDPNANWIDFLVRCLATETELENPQQQVVFDQIRNGWRQFMEKDLRKIKQMIDRLPELRPSSS